MTFALSKFLKIGYRDKRATKSLLRSIMIAVASIILLLVNVDAFSQAGITEISGARITLSGTSPSILKPGTKTDVTIHAKMSGISDYSTIKVQVDGDIFVTLFHAKNSNAPLNSGSFKASIIVSTESIPVDSCLTLVAKAISNSKEIAQSEPYELCVSSFSASSQHGDLGPILVDPETRSRYAANELYFVAVRKTKEATILEIAESINASVSSWNPLLNIYRLKLSNSVPKYSDLVNLRETLLAHPAVERSNLVTISTMEPLKQ